VEQFRNYANIPYEDYEEVKKQTKCWKHSSTSRLWELFYRSTIFSLFVGAGIKALPEIHGHLGRSALVLEHKQQIWLIELKVVRTNESDEQKASEALAQIKTNNYHAKY
jgi:hypothetical protein